MQFTLQGTILSTCITEFKEKCYLHGITVKGNDPLWYPTKGDHSNKQRAYNRATTGIVTPYMYMADLKE